MRGQPEPARPSPWSSTSRFRAWSRSSCSGTAAFLLGDLPYFLTCRGTVSTGSVWRGRPRPRGGTRRARRTPSRPYWSFRRPAGTARSVDRAPLRLPARQISQLEREAPELPRHPQVVRRRRAAASNASRSWRRPRSKATPTMLRVHVGDEASVRGRTATLLPPALGGLGGGRERTASRRTCPTS